MTEYLDLIYTRISDDREGLALGVTRQTEDTQEMAVGLSGERVPDERVFTDNDISASTRSTKRREHFERMVDTIRSSPLPCRVFAYSNSRLTRRPIELEGLIRLHEETGVVFHTKVSGKDDLSTADGRMIARIRASVDAGEAERIGERVARQKRQRAELGLPQGGRERLFGYTRTWEVIEDEAKVIREAFDRRARGESTTAIANDLAARGITTVAGKPWRAGTLGTTLKKPGYAGLREFKGEIIGKTAYPSIIPEATFVQVNSNLTKDSKGTNARKHLLSGFLICSRCWTSMKGNSHMGTYRCSATYGGCGSTTIQIRWTNQPIIDAAIRKHEEQRERLGVEAEVPRDYEAEAKEIADEIEAYQAAASAREISPADVLPILRGLRKQRDQIIKEQVEEQARTRYDHGTEAQMDFDSDDPLTLSRKRVYIGEVISSVVVYPPKGRGRQRQDNSRLEVHYKDGEIIRLAGPESTPAPSAS